MNTGKFKQIIGYSKHLFENNSYFKQDLLDVTPTFNLEKEENIISRDLNGLLTNVNIMSSKAEIFKQFKIQTSSNSDDEYIKGFRSGKICFGVRTQVKELDIKRKESKLQELLNLRDVFLKNEEKKRNPMLLWVLK